MKFVIYDHIGPQFVVNNAHVKNARNHFVWAACLHCT